MTMLASWVGVDTHGPASAYIVSDSRFTWKKGFNTEKFDYGKKVFASKTYPEIFGYSGDVLFPSVLLSQIIEMIDSDILFSEIMTCEQKNKIIFNKLVDASRQYPILCGIPIYEILHISRDTYVDKGYPRFHIYVMRYTQEDGWACNEIQFPTVSGLLIAMGSGAEEFKSNYRRYQTGLNNDTSRNVFHCFIDSLFNVNDSQCGGAPQLAGIYRKSGSPAKLFGIVYMDKRYFAGSEIPENANYEKIEWRNEEFELVNGRTQKRLDGAERQPDFLRRK